MHIARVGEKLSRLQIQFRISRSFRPRNLSNLRSKIRFWIRRKEHTLTVRHVFVGFVEGIESGTRNPDCGIRNPFPFVICGKSLRIYNIFLYLFFLNYRILSRKSQKSS